jgi:hypothetical protein
MREKEHVIDVLEKAEKAIKQGDVIELKNLSDKTIHSASIYQDPDNVAVAVVLYALSKIIERERYQEYKDWDIFQKAYEVSIKRAIIALKKDDIEEYRQHIAEIRKAVKTLGGNFKKHMELVFRKAQINKASRLYEHGLSAEKTAKILGITLWELNQYVGQTGIADVNLAYTKELDDRIKLAENIFRK